METCTQKRSQRAGIAAGPARGDLSLHLCLSSTCDTPSTLFFLPRYFKATVHTKRYQCHKNTGWRIYSCPSSNLLAFCTAVQTTSQDVRQYKKFARMYGLLFGPTISSTLLISFSNSWNSANRHIEVYTRWLSKLRISARTARQL